MLKVPRNMNDAIKSREKLRKPNVDCFFAKFRYERLLDFFFYCGKFDHMDKFRAILYEMAGDKASQLCSTSIILILERQLEEGTITRGNFGSNTTTSMAEKMKSNKIAILKDP